MAYVPIGNQETDSPKTPTLRQFSKLYPDRRPKVCTVTTIFLPGRYPNLTLVTETGFKVSILEDNPMYSVIRSSVEDWSNGLVCLVIIPSDWEKGSFDVSINTDECADWEAKSWGYRLTVKEKPKSRARK